MAFYFTLCKAQRITAFGVKNTTGMAENVIVIRNISRDDANFSLNCQYS